jgi:hypothetical protein
MTDHNRGVQIDHQTRQGPPGRPRRREHLPGELGPLRPHHLTRRRPSRRDRVQRNAVELIQQPPARRVRRDRAEQLGLISQHRDCRRSSSHHQPLRPPYRPAPALDHGGRGAYVTRESSAVSVVRSPTSASNRDPACDTTPSPSAVAVIRGRVPIACTSKVLLYLDDLGPQQVQSSLVAGHFPLSGLGHGNTLTKSRG